MDQGNGHFYIRFVLTQAMDLFRRLIEIGRSRLDDRLRRETPRLETEGFGPGNTDPREEPGSRRSDVDPALAEYYANLELPYGSDLETVRTAWRRMMKQYHPDRHARDEEKRRTADELTARLTRAYRELETALSNRKKEP